MINIENEYLNLLQEVLNKGTLKEDRTGTGTISLFGKQIRHNMSLGFPLLTTKKMFTKGIVGELIWFLNGETNIQPLVKNGINIWVGDCYKDYLKRMENNTEEPLSKVEFIDKIKNDDEFAKAYGDLGPVYGKQWRKWGGSKMVPNGWNHGLPISFKEENKFDQIIKLIEDIKTNPDSRRLMVSAWNVGEIDKVVLPPCHYGFQVYTRELSITERMGGGDFSNMLKFYRSITDEEHQRYSLDENGMKFDMTKLLNERGVPTRAISLMWNQRSCDLFLGIPFNIASYAILLTMIAKEVNMVPDELIGNLGDCHIYTNHINQCKEQIDRDIKPLPTLTLNDVDSIFDYNIDDIQFHNYEHHPIIKGDISN